MIRPHPFVVIATGSRGGCGEDLLQVGGWLNADYTSDIGGSDEEFETVRGTVGLRITSVKRVPLLPRQPGPLAHALHVPCECGTRMYPRRQEAVRQFRSFCWRTLFLDDP
jgi:hypothetical protein